MENKEEKTPSAITTLKDMNIFGYVIHKNTTCIKEGRRILLNGPENWGRTIEIDPVKFIKEVEKQNLLPNHKA